MFACYKLKPIVVFSGNVTLHYTWKLGIRTSRSTPGSSCTCRYIGHVYMCNITPMCQIGIKCHCMIIDWHSDGTHGGHVLEGKCLVDTRSNYF